MLQYYDFFVIFATTMTKIIRKIKYNHMKTKHLMLALLACFCLTNAKAQTPMEINLWQGKPAVSNGNDADTAKVYVYLPDAKTATGRAIVICPGGAYARLAMNHEGKDWSGYLNNLGIAAIVLKYRMPNGNLEVPIADAEAAFKLVRDNASSWHINRNDIGIMGFSAGGHLASVIATHSKGDAKPNFQILFYPVITMLPGYTHQQSHDNLLGKDARKKDEKDYSSDLQVTRVTPRAFIALSDDDKAVMPANGVNYYLELYRHDVPATLHVFPSGGHGWGIRPNFKFHTTMLQELKDWLQEK